MMYFTSKKWIFRSPSTSNPRFAWYVTSSGVVDRSGYDYAVDYSFGRSSPRTDFDHVTCFVYLTGDIYVSGYGVDSNSGGLSD